ncbi:hypothetical protein [Marmoricola sp. RAF53]|uniref:hypothetical protein n=1 Tax=Marmoricola sp. RAF53 TaxID=3233059 RepID=UPI003F97EDD8
MRVLLVLLVVALVNLPAVHERWTDHQIQEQGVFVEGIVKHARTIDGRNLVDYTLPKDFDPKQTLFSVALDDEAYYLAKTKDRIAVTAIPGKPGMNRPEGEKPNPLFTVAAITADLILLVVAALWVWRRRQQGRRPDWLPPLPEA